MTTAIFIYPRKAMLARHVLRPVSVCLSVCHNSYSIEMDEWIELVFGSETTLVLCYNVLKRNLNISKNKGYFPLVHCPKL